jgi:hypothetical protein
MGKTAKKNKTQGHREQEDKSDITSSSDNSENHLIEELNSINDDVIS